MDFQPLADASSLSAFVLGGASQKQMIIYLSYWELFKLGATGWRESSA
ncbi:MAG: hypothetical protein AAF633_02960 [Chloroflexota bacterium]